MLDPVESAFLDMCNHFRFIVERPAQGRIDFYLPDFNLHVECKQYSTPRLHSQLESMAAGPLHPAMVLVGTESVQCLRRMIESAVRSPQAEK